MQQENGVHKERFQCALDLNRVLEQRVHSLQKSLAFKESHSLQERTRFQRQVQELERELDQRSELFSKQLKQITQKFVQEFSQSKPTTYFKTRCPEDLQDQTIRKLEEEGRAKDEEIQGLRQRIELADLHSAQYTQTIQRLTLALRAQDLQSKDSLKTCQKSNFMLRDQVETSLLQLRTLRQKVDSRDQDLRNCQLQTNRLKIQLQSAGRLIQQLTAELAEKSTQLTQSGLSEELVRIQNQLLKQRCLNSQKELEKVRLQRERQEEQVIIELRHQIQELQKNYGNDRGYYQKRVSLFQQQSQFFLQQKEQVESELKSSLLKFKQQLEENDLTIAEQRKTIKRLQSQLKNQSKGQLRIGVGFKRRKFVQISNLL